MAREFRLQLRDLITGRAIHHGGKFFVVAHGAANKLDITDETGADITSATNSASVNSAGTITGGQIFFKTANSVESVDIYGYTDAGYPFQVIGAKSNQLSEVNINLMATDHTLMIPFDIDDTDVGANTEYFTGMTFTGNEIVLPYGLGVNVLTADAAITIDLGTDGGSNDQNGLIESISVAATGFIPAKVGFDVGSNAAFVDLTGGDENFTIGALLCGNGTKVALAEGSDVDTDEGFYVLEPYVTSASDQITFKFLTGADTGAGIFHIPTKIINPAGVL